MQPIVLVENEVTAGGRYDFWEDVTGERYQFPNQYKSQIRSGRRFVYYRGVRRAGGKRGPMEYFGHGVIGDVEADPGNPQAVPAARRKWIASIAEYTQFKEPVPASVHGRYIEQIARNLWGVPRNLAESAYDRILRLAGESPMADPLQASEALNLPDLELVQPSIALESLLPVISPKSPGGLGGGGYANRRSRHSVALGRRGEAAVMRYLKATLVPKERKSIQWVSDKGETPGWDIQYEAEAGVVRIEVKASSGPVLPVIELTANEWSAAMEHRQNYLLALVADVRTAKPRIEFIRDPLQFVENGQFDVEPSGWKLRRLSA